MKGAVNNLMRYQSARGSVQPRFLDIVVAVVLLGILLYAATREFPTYNKSPSPAPTAQASR